MVLGKLLKFSMLQSISKIKLIKVSVIYGKHNMKTKYVDLCRVLRLVPAHGKCHNKAQTLLSLVLKSHLSNSKTYV